MQITFEKLLRGGYRATLGAQSECGPTKAQAQDALLALFAAMPSDTEPVVMNDGKGKNWVLWFEGRSWIYRIGNPGACCVCSGTKQHALRAMRRHMATY
jgi:hypothetical protein